MLLHGTAGDDHGSMSVLNGSLNTRGRHLLEDNIMHASAGHVHVCLTHRGKLQANTSSLTIELLYELLPAASRLNCLPDSFTATLCGPCCDYKPLLRWRPGIPVCHGAEGLDLAEPRL